MGRARLEGGGGVTEYERALAGLPPDFDVGRSMQPVPLDAQYLSTDPSAGSPTGGSPQAGPLGDFRSYGELSSNLAAGDPAYNAAQAQLEGAADWGAIEAQLRQAAAARGVDYDPSDLEGIRRNAGYDQVHRGSGANYERALNEGLSGAIARYDQRATNTPGGGGSGGGVPGGGAPGMGGAGGGVGGAPQSIQPFGQQFTAPTLDEVRNSPGFQFRLGEAMQAIERSGLAKGTYFTNRTARAMQGQASDLASAEYDKLFNQKMGGLTTNRDTHFLNEGGRYDSERANRLDDFGMFDTNRKFDFGVMDSNRNFGRATTNDQWGRGVDLWGMNRQTGLDQFNQGATIAELINRYTPRPG